MNVRKDFPILEQSFNGMPPIYFDNACMTLRPTSVVRSIVAYYEEYPACAMRSHHKLSKMATEHVEKARTKTQKFFGSKNLIYTKNTTESINLVANSFAKQDVVICGKEHNSNLIPWQINKNRKYYVTKLNEDNLIDEEDFENKVRNKDVKLASIVHSSNLDGTTEDVKKFAKIAHDHDAKILIDGAQSAPHKEINFKKLDVDFFAASGHKMLGPTGMGILLVKNPEELSPFIVGGETVLNSTYESHTLEPSPYKFEAGLQHYAGIIGLGEATDYLKKIGMNTIQKHEEKLNKMLHGLLLQHQNISIIGNQNPEKRGGISSFRVKGTDNHTVAMMFDQTRNIMLRSGMHCCHSWFNNKKLDGSARASLYLYNTKEEIEVFGETLNKLMQLW